MAAALKAALTVVYVEPTQGGRGRRTVEEERQLRQNRQLADELGATVVRLRGKVADELAAYARAHNVATVVIGHPTHSRWEEFLHGSVTNDLLRKMRGVDVHVIADWDQERRKEPG
jgi:two-component system sensor histidine kinase KdpD